MMTTHSDVSPETPTQSLKRRGLLAAAVALVAGLVAKLTEQPVSAGVDGDVVLGASNTTGGTTFITNTTLSSTAMAVSCIVGPSGWGLLGSGSQYGILGQTTAGNGAGVYGTANGNASGVLGINASGIGVRGDSTLGNGVVGQSFSSVPILGQVAPGSNANTIAIYALNNSSYKGASPGAGGFGIYGLCANGHGLVGATATAGAAAVVGATNGVAGAYAGVFYGPVLVGGAFTVVGGPKSAAVPHPDGTHRRMYCLESPESWFEDFGTGTLECGRAEIAIDPDFAALVDLSNYHVFLTEHDTHQHLIVRHRTAAAFAVEADAEMAALKGKQDADLNGAFSWRVVAKRKDIKGERLETVTIPPEPILPPLPDIPTLTPPTTGHQH